MYDITLKAQYVEIYNEQVCDLLATGEAPIGKSVPKLEIRYELPLNASEDSTPHLSSGHRIVFQSDGLEDISLLLTLSGRNPMVRCMSMGPPKYWSSQEKRWLRFLIKETPNAPRHRISESRYLFHDDDRENIVAVSEQHLPSSPCHAE